MAYVDNVNVARNWEECPREAKEARWAALYASMNPEGDIVISGFTHERLGGPQGYVLLFDRERQVIGMRPAVMAVEKNAYPARPRGRHGGQRIRGYRMCREFGIQLARTVRFHKCQVDNSGVLILDLKDTRPVGRKG
ncbi:MAG: hypothetical protein LC734_04340 [Acidobacteria bacterium]|nr:hypothetical protein [Acidobacteriota bacterium]